MNFTPPALAPFHFTTFREAVTRLTRRCHAVAVLIALALFAPGAAHAVISQPFDWGNSGNGALGNGSTAGSTTPVAVTATGVLAGKSIVAVSSGAFHCLALAADGTVYAWGDNTRGQLGNNSASPSFATPVAVNTAGALAGKTITAIAAGDFFSLALDSAGKVYAWGYNGFGALGNNSALFVNSLVPVAVDTTGVLLGKTVTRIAAGSDFAIARTSDGKVFTWGANGNNQLGNGLTFATAPSAVDMTGALSGLSVFEIAAGGQHVVVSASDGKLYAWGLNTLGQLGNGGGTPTVPVAVTLTGAAAGKSFTGPVAAGQGHSLALANTGELYAWGDGSQSQLGNGSPASSNVPVAVTMTGALAGQSVAQIGAGYYHCVVLTSSDRVFTWGANSNGELGTGGGSSSVPVAVSTTGALSGYGISSIGTGASATRTIVTGYLIAPLVTSISPNQTVIVGASVNLTATATGAALTYQWAKGGVAIPGANALTYSIASAALTDAGSYSFTATNSSGAHSLGTTLFVNAPSGPVITTQPGSQTVTVGSSATFTVAATGTSLSYQWYKGGTGIPGATSATFTLPSTVLGDAGSYTVVIINSGGSVTSNAAVLAVNSIAGPGITTQPTSRTVTVGASTTFSVVATGSGLTYQWNKTGIAIGGATGASFTIASCATTDAGAYTVTVTNSGGSTTSSVATLTVNLVGPTITTPPASQSANVGSGVSFTVAASGASLTYQWFKAGVTISGATNATYAIPSVASTDAAAYTVTVSNSGGSVTSAAATLTINAAALTQTVSLAGIADRVFGAAPFGVSGSSSAGLPLVYSIASGPATISGSTVTVTGVGTVTVLANQPGGAGYSGASATQSFNVGKATATFTFTNLAATFDGSPKNVTVTTAPAGLATTITYDGAATVPSAAGNHTVVATVSDANYTGTATATQVISVAPPTFTLQPVSQSVLAGTTGVTFTAAASSTPAATYQWMFNGKPIAGATSATFTVATALPDQAGVYTVVATNPGGSITSNAANLAINADQRLVNLSTRALVSGGDNVAIAGFVIDGTVPRAILLRAIGPGLTDFGLTGVLSRPTLSLYQGSTRLALNTGWGTATNAADIASTAAALGAFALKTGSADSALLVTLPPGAYTAVVTAATNATPGIALVEVYDTAATVPGLVNLASRGTVVKDDQVFITGFSLSGSVPKKLLIRAVGPTLTTFGVAGAIADPQLKLYRGSTLVAANDNWGNDPELVALSSQTGSFPQSGAFPLAATSNDAALITTLDSGSYTIVVSGVGGSTGVVLVEVYQLP